MRHICFAIALTTAGATTQAWAQATAEGRQPPPAAPQQSAQSTSPSAAAFPANARLAYVDVGRIVAESAEGKAARAKLASLQESKKADLQKRQEAVQAAQQKLVQSGTVLNEAARDQLQKDVARLERELQRASQDAQDELTSLNRDLDTQFQRKLAPLLDKIAKEKGLLKIFNLGDAGLLWWDPRLDLSQDVIKLLDGGAAGSPAPAKPD
jgi:outer membrane protein